MTVKKVKCSVIGCNTKCGSDAFEANGSNKLCASCAPFYSGDDNWKVDGVQYEIEEDLIKPCEKSGCRNLAFQYEDNCVDCDSDAFPVTKESLLACARTFVPILQRLAASDINYNLDFSSIANTFVFIMREDKLNYCEALKRMLALYNATPLIAPPISEVVSVSQPNVQVTQDAINGITINICFAKQ